MVVFIELPCDLHFAPLGLPARAAGSRRGPSKRVFRLGAMASQDSCANGAEGLGFAGRTGCAACFALFCMKSPPWPYGMRGNGRRPLAEVAARWRSDSRTQRGEYRGFAC